MITGNMRDSRVVRELCRDVSEYKRHEGEKLGERGLTSGGVMYLRIRAERCAEARHRFLNLIVYVLRATARLVCCTTLDLHSHSTYAIQCAAGHRTGHTQYSTL